MDAKIKRWGNSLGVILPKKMVDENKLKVHDTIEVVIKKKKSFLNFYGALKDSPEFDDIMGEIINSRKNEKGRKNVSFRH
ncbi:hypothetical protein CL622_08290 [archaeon]|nr:hypothetical protein [archaeon]|tara:strand:- start:412 stop:651 length:240 start_codon:yes stop_codon:yes gene_type:complete